MAITITVPGRPSRWMRPGQGFDREGGSHRYTDDHAQKGKDAIQWEAKRAYGLRRPATGPVAIRVIAIFAIPPSWPEKLKAAARECRVLHVSDPDIDQIAKQAMDALKGVAFVDDNQVCGLSSCAKRYGHPERTEIMIEVLPQQEDERTPGQRRLEKRVEVEGWDAVLAPPPKRKKRSNTDLPDGLQASGGTRGRAKWAGPRARAQWGRGRGS